MQSKFILDPNDPLYQKIYDAIPGTVVMKEDFIVAFTAVLGVLTDPAETDLGSRGLLLLSASHLDGDKVVTSIGEAENTATTALQKANAVEAGMQPLELVCNAIERAASNTGLKVEDPWTILKSYNDSETPNTQMIRVCSKIDELNGRERVTEDKVAQICCSSIVTNH